jgi:multidrug efflux pump subunit AcrA (membrane-fusion protein)
MQSHKIPLIDSKSLTRLIIGIKNKMNMSYYKLLITAFAFSSLLACKTEIKQEETADVSQGTPVTLTNPGIGNMKDEVELNAVSAFLLKTNVKSNANGYLQLVNASLGKLVNKGDELFVIKTKEASTLGVSISGLDSSLHFEGAIHVKAPGTGYISQINYRPGDYVQDGEALATITDIKSFVFLLELPYELKTYLPGNKQVQLKLPDASVLNGVIEAALLTVDPVSQTQSYIIRVNKSTAIPENLIAKVSLVKKAKQNTISVPKAALLSNETQSEFWIMKMIDSNTAVRVDIIKGIETNSHVEILSPKLSPLDKIILTGHYGLSDTAKVVIKK